MDRDSDEQSVYGENAFDEDSSASSSDLNGGEQTSFIADLPRARNNDPSVYILNGHGIYNNIQNITNEEWEDIGRDISNNTYLEEFMIIQGALDDEKLSSLFRGLLRSSSIVKLDLDNNEFSRAGLRSLEPFLQNSIKLRELDVRYNSIQSGGFNSLLQALCGSPIEDLYCGGCDITSIEVESVPNNLKLLSLSDNNILSEGFNRVLRSLRDSSIEDLNCSECRIESIEIDIEYFPKNLNILDLADNGIKSNGCYEIAKLLQEGDITLKQLYLQYNFIGDQGVAILVDALKTNTTLEFLALGNNGISINGHILILKILNDISSIKSTLQSNHTLQTVSFGDIGDDSHHHNNMALSCNRRYTVAAGREKVIQTQLHSKKRAKLVAMQGIGSQSVYGEIKPLHLPEVLSLVSRRHGQEELYLALKASIAELLSTVNRRLCLQQRRSYHAEEIDAETAALDSADDSDGGIESRGNKRLRV